VFNDAGADVDFRVEGDTEANLLFVDASADAVGIGTSSPASRLDVNGKITLRNGSDSRLGYIQNTGGALFIGSETSGTEEIVFQTNGPTERMRINSAGNVGIGTSSPGEKLHVNGNIRVEGNTSEIFMATGAERTISASGSSAATAMTFKRWNGSSYVSDVTMDGSGNLLVGTTSVTIGTRLEVNNSSGSAAAFVCPAAGDSTVFSHNKATSGDNGFINFGTEASYTSRGTITYNRTAGLVAYNTTSDYRAKDISGPVTDSGTLIDSTPVYMGKMKGATQERPMFIAHEVPAYAHTGEKDAVDADGKPVYQQMDASALIPVMWAEIQDLRKRLAAANL
jgi:hypothetical protein